MGLRTKKGSPFALFVIVLALVALVFSLFFLNYEEIGTKSGGEKHEQYSEWSDFEFISEWHIKEAFEGTTATKLTVLSFFAAIVAAFFLLVTGIGLLCGGSKKLLLLSAFFLLVAGGLWSAYIVSSFDDGIEILFKPYGLIWAPCLLLLLVALVNTCSSMNTSAPLALTGIVLCAVVVLMSLFAGTWFFGIYEESGYYYTNVVFVSHLISFGSMFLGIGVGALALEPSSRKTESYAAPAYSMPTYQPAAPRAAAPTAPAQRFDPMTGKPIAPATPAQRFDPMTGKPVAPAAPVQRFDPMTGKPITPTAPTQPTPTAVEPEAPTPDVRAEVASFVQTVKAEEVKEAPPVFSGFHAPETLDETPEETQEAPAEESAAVEEIPAPVEEPAEPKAEFIAPTPAEEPCDEAAAEPAPDVDYVKVMQQLRQMHELGLINEEEYAEKRKLLLEKM